VIRVHEQGKTAHDFLQSVRAVANSFTTDSAVTMTPEDVNAAIGTANTALQTMLPMFEQQHNIAQQEIRDAVSAVYACHHRHGGGVRTSSEQAVARDLTSKNACNEALAVAVSAEEEACAGQGDDPNCLCNEARVAITDQTALCDAVTETYEVAYCANQESCHEFHDCDFREIEVYQRIRADIEAAMTARQEEYRTFMQVECLMNLITTAMLSGTPIDHASLVACDDVHVDHLAIDFPELPQAPAACSERQAGEPHCLAGYAPADLGACRTADGDGGSGMYSRADHVETVEQCARQCDANPTCFAFEFTGVTIGNTGCELHRQPMPVATGHSNGICFNKIRAGPVLAGYGPGNQGACRTAGGDGGSGMYSRADHVENVEQCASECDASPTCVAFEFIISSTQCELHRQSMPAATGHANGLCYNSLSGPVVVLPPQPVVHDSRLTAYWDSGDCGPRGDDYNWGLCGQTAGNCPESVRVPRDLCASATARLETMSGTGECCSSVVLDGCNYAYHAQYVCVDA